MPQTEALMGGTTYITYYDAINEQKAKALMALCADVIATQKPDRLYFLFSSPGGSVSAGVTLFNYLRSLPVPIVMHNTGSVDSIAAVVFLAADERYANPHASFLLHGVKWGFPQGANLDWPALQETVNSFKGDEARISGIITGRTQMSAEELERLYRQGDLVGPALAKEKGLIRDVLEAKVPSGTSLISCNFA